MSARGYVKHISGQGQVWERCPGYDTSESFCVYTKTRHHHNLPIEDYVPCDPPERWVDVTEQCEARMSGKGVFPSEELYIEHSDRRIEALPMYYRLRKVQINDANPYKGARWVFLVERKEPA